MDEVGTALISIALVLSAVFIPTAFVSGITGQFYRQFARHHRVRDDHLGVRVADAQPGAGGDAVQAARRITPRSSICMAPVHLLFGGFNRGVRGAGRAATARSCARLARITALMLVVYAGLIACAIGFVMRMPTGFIPALDRGILIVSLQLPAGASLERTDGVVRKAPGDSSMRRRASGTRTATRAGRASTSRTARTWRRSSACSTISSSATTRA